jgi:iron complex outermembrane receptor protein
MEMKSAGRQLVLLLALAVAAAWAHPARATEDVEPSTEPVDEQRLLFMEIPSVFGASKYEQKVTEAPASVTIVTADDIRKYGYRTLADVLRSARGFYTSYDRQYDYLGVRGFSLPGDYVSRTLILIDGHRVNDNVYEQGSIGNEFPVDIDLIDRVEIIRGPSSSLYGASAFFAVVNVITKGGRNLEGAQVSGEVASFDTYKSRLSYGRRLGRGLEFLLSGTYYDSEGPERLYFPEFDDPATHFGIAENVDDERIYRLFAKLAFRDLSLQGAYLDREKGVPTANWETFFNDPRNRSWDKRAYVDLAYKHFFSNLLNLAGRLYYDHYGYTQDYVYDWPEPGDPPDLHISTDETRGDWLGGELELTKQIFGRHTLLFGAEFVEDLRQDQRYFDQEPFFEYLDDERTGTSYAFLGQGDFRIIENLILNVGVRYDRFPTFGGTTNPRSALIYQPFRETTLKFLYGQAFRAPNAYELYYTDGMTFKTNEALEPERIRTYELTWEQSVGRQLRTLATGYYYDIDDLITQTTDPADDMLVYQNSESVDAKGFELELYGSGPKGLEGRISYTYQDAKNTGTERTPVNSPAHLAKLNLVLPLVQERFFLGLEVQYVSETETLAGDMVDDYVLANMTFLVDKLVSGLEFSASVYNVFDERYGVAGAGEHIQQVIEQDGRTFRIKLSYGF